MFKRFILWDFPRASWQYDVMVGIILAFIFLTPRDFFRDQPRIPRASSVALLPSENGQSVFWVDPELLTGVREDQRAARLADILRAKLGNKRAVITRVEPVLGSENELEGYLAFVRP
jgi:hypothetical protein